MKWVYLKADRMPRSWQDATRTNLKDIWSLQVGVNTFIVELEDNGRYSVEYGTETYATLEEAKKAALVEGLSDILAQRDMLTQIADQIAGLIADL